MQSPYPHQMQLSLRLLCIGGTLANLFSLTDGGSAGLTYIIYMDIIRIPAEGMDGCIHSVRGKLVMIDRDLAACFGLETRVFNQSFKRKLQLFGAEDLFQLTKEELLTSQIVISSWGGSRHLPYAFTEEGVRVLAQVLKRQVEVDFASGYVGGGLLPKPWSEGTVVLYQPNKETSIEVKVEEETVWLTQEQMALLFGSTPQNITLHIKNVYEEKELEIGATCKDFLQVRFEGTRNVSRMEISAGELMGKM